MDSKTIPSDSKLPWIIVRAPKEICDLHKMFYKVYQEYNEQDDTLTNKVVAYKCGGIRGKEG